MVLLIYHSIRQDFIAVKNDNHEERETILMLEKCLRKTKMWVDENWLKMNCSKTKLIFFGSRQKLQKCITTYINVNGDKVHRSSIIKYLGAWMDEQLTMKHHITNKCRLAMYNIQKIKLIRPTLTENAIKTILLGTVISHLDYVNSILIGLPDTDYKKLQQVQNIAFKLVMKETKTDNATECLRTLHWLPIKYWIKHKIATLVYKSPHQVASQYLQDLIKLEVKNHGRSMRSTNNCKLCTSQE